MKRRLLLLVDSKWRDALVEKPGNIGQLRDIQRPSIITEYRAFIDDPDVASPGQSLHRSFLGAFPQLCTPCGAGYMDKYTGICHF